MVSCSEQTLQPTCLFVTSATFDGIPHHTAAVAPVSAPRSPSCPSAINKRTSSSHNLICKIVFWADSTCVPPDCWTPFSDSPPHFTATVCSFRCLCESKYRHCHRRHRIIIIAPPPKNISTPCYHGSR